MDEIGLGYCPLPITTVYRACIVGDEMAYITSVGVIEIDGQ